MAFILNIETSSVVCSVCLARDGVVFDYREDKQGNSHARVLTVLIDEMMMAQRLAYGQLDAVAVSAGPGSYTGLRIGTSVAKGLCYALNKPLIGVPTLKALAAGIKKNINDKSAFYMPVIDARRMDIYTAIFDYSENEVVRTVKVTADKHLEKTIVNYPKVWIGGNAVNKCRQVFSSMQIDFADGLDGDSRNMALISESKFNRKEFEDLAYFQPEYLQEFVTHNK